MIPSPFRWGILGPGKIARKFATSLPFSKNGKLTAVASRTEGKAEAFAADFGNVAAFQNYTDLLESGLVDAVYVAGTHNLHLEQATICLERGIPVLCEKPLTERLSDTQALYALASARQAFLMEGMWSIFLPHIQKAFEWIQEKRIGQLVHIQADFAYRADRNPDNRLFNPALGGSVSKDIGIYPLFLFHTLGKGIQELQHSGWKAETGIDEHVVFQGLTSSGASFQGMISFCGKSAAKASIIGTDGRIDIDSQWFRPVSARLQNAEGIEFFHAAVPGFGFQYEANEVEACVRNRKLHSAIWTPEDSIAMAKWMDVLQS